MYLFNKTSPCELEKGRSITLTDATSTIIRCRAGALWVTQDNDVRDIVLEAGGEFQPDRKGRVVVYALAAASVSWAPVRGAERSSWQTGLSRLVQLLASSVESRHPSIE